MLLKTLFQELNETELKLEQNLQHLKQEWKFKYLYIKKLEILLL
jgi:hypothetical protein